LTSGYRISSDVINNAIETTRLWIVKAEAEMDSDGFNLKATEEREEK